MIVAIAVVFICLMLSVIIDRDIFSPGTIVSAVWLFCLIAFNVYPHSLFFSIVKFYQNITIWVLLFTLSSLFMKSIYLKQNHSNEPNNVITKIYFYITIVAFPLVSFKIIQLITELGINDNYFYYLRLAALGRLKGLGDGGTSKNFFAVIWLVAFLMELLHYDKKNKWRIIVLFAVNFLWALMIMAKLVFLTLFVSILFILYKKNIVKFRHLIVSVGVVFSFFLFLQIQRTHESMKSKDEKLTYDFFTQYVLAGMPGFEMAKPSSSKHFGENTFRFYYALTYRTGLGDVKPVNPVMHFTDVSLKKSNPMYTNTYTALYPFYKDFGNKGVAVFAIIIGVLFGYLYQKSKRGNNPMTLVYAILVSLLLVQFMTENIMTALSLNIQIFVFAHLPYWVKGNFVFKLKKND